MLWIILLVLCCLQTVRSERCKNTEIIVGHLGMELEFNFSLSDLRNEYRKQRSERDEKRAIQNEISIQDLKINLLIRFKNKMDSIQDKDIYKNGKSLYMDRSKTEIFLTNDVLVVKKTKLQKEDVGIYWVDFDVIHFGQKALIIAGKPTIIGGSPPNTVLKPENNYTSTIQLECHSVSTSIGDCQLFMYTMWYRNGMRMTDVDPTLSQINVTVDHNGGSFTCLATDYLPCYQRLQTTKHYNVEDCNNVSESETFFIYPEHPPIDVKLEPDQREIIINKKEDLKVKCSAKCHPQCDVTWEKDYQVIQSSGWITTENRFENDLVIENVNSSNEGYFGCLVDNIHGEVKKGFILRVKETENKALNIIVIWIVIACVTVVVVGVIVILAIRHRKYPKKKNVPQPMSSEEEEHFYDSIDESSPENLEDADSYELMELQGTSRDNNSRNGEPGTSRDNNSRNGESGTSRDNTSRNGEPGTSRDNTSRNGEPGTSRDNTSRNGEPGTSRDNNSRNGEPGTSRDNTSRNGEPGTSRDNNSRNGEPGTSRDNTSRNGESGTSREHYPRNSESETSTDNNSRSSEQNMNPVSDRYDSLEFDTLEIHIPDHVSRYTRLYKKHKAKDMDQEPGTSSDNDSRKSESGTSSDNNSRNSESGTSSDNNSRNSEPGSSSDNNSKNGEPGTSIDNNSRNGASGTSRNNNSRNSESGTSTDTNSRNSDQYLTPVSDRYDSLEFDTLEAHKPDLVSRYTRLSQKHQPTAKDMDLDSEK